MRIVLLEKIANYGAFGDIVDVKPGYARNYLLPGGKALLATGANLKYFEERKQQLLKASEDAKLQAEARANEFAGTKLLIKAQTDADGKLFGSVSAKEVVDAAQEVGLNLKKQEVLLPPNERIRNVGDYEVKLELHHDVPAVANVKVVSSST